MQQTSSPATPPTPTPAHSYPNENSDLDYNLPGTRYTDPVPALDQAGPIVHDYACDGPAPGRLAFRWIHGSRVAATNTDPRIQVVQYNGDTFVLRQNVCLHWEAPFTYLLFGNKGALLIDSGATANDQYYPLRETVDAIITRWSQIRKRTSVPLFHRNGIPVQSDAQRDHHRHQFLSLQLIARPPGGNNAGELP